MEKHPHSGDCEHDHLLTYDATQDRESAFLRKIDKVLPQGVTFQKMVNFKVFKYVDHRGTWKAKNTGYCAKPRFIYLQIKQYFREWSLRAYGTLGTWLDSNMPEKNIKSRKNVLLVPLLVWKERRNP